jgi:predicted  nucleic acid-binding Zn-ribbon protein
MSDLEKDYDHIRKNLYDLNGQGEEAIELMMELARESEHPRAFEVLGQLIKQNAEISEKLMKLHKTNKEIKTKIQDTASEITNNNLFIGSTTELQKMLRDEKVIDGDTETG